MLYLFEWQSYDIQVLVQNNNKKIRKETVSL